MFFKCKHPFDSLVVEKGSTKENYDEDFDHVTFHLYCIKCNSSLEITYAATIGGIEGFMSRGKK